ncbi:MAG TPA: ABC transporter substrate-binding protein [Candidatus Polarisedimenticolaceae bacterium]|nr:ABC transporter substrate-binding protein [Candidatus Polarisedimenticolaceae bacterium]
MYPRSALASLLALAILPACGSSEAGGRQAEAAARPRQGGSFQMVLEGPSCLEPACVDSVYDALPIGQIFDGLVALDAGLNVVPRLADTWTISRDGRTYTIHLRNGVTFHDGSPLTADDVVFSIERLLDPRRARRSIACSYLEVIKGADAYSRGKAKRVAGVKALDPSRIEISLDRPYLSFLEVLAMDDLRISPRSVVTARGERAFRRAPVGTGPFKLASWTAQELRLVANEQYFAGRPHLDEVVIHFPAPGERDQGNARFLRGETQIVEPTSDSLPVLAKDPTVELHRYQELSLSFFGIQTGAPPWDDERVRKAIAQAIDRKALQQISAATRREAQGILPPGLPGYSPSPKAPAYDPEAAKALLAKAGYPGGRGLPPLRFYTAQTQSSAVARSNEKLRDDLAKVGVRLEIHEVPWSRLIELIEDSAAPAFQLGWIADLPDPDAFLRTLFEPGGSANYFNFLDPDTAAALERGASETNPIERARIYRELEKSILEKAPLIPLFHSMGMIASRREVHGLTPGPMGIASLDLETVWLDPGAR